MALMAVKMGAQYLPADPHAAVRLANSYVQSQGIAPAEISSLNYKIPTFVAVLAMGRLPARNVEVTASAWRQDAQFPSRARNALSFPFSNEPQKRVVTSANWLVQRRHRVQDFTRRPGSLHTPQEMLLEAEQAGPATRQIFSGKSSVLYPAKHSSNLHRSRISGSITERTRVAPRKRSHGCVLMTTGRAYAS
jgi:hypothetical protein